MREVMHYRTEQYGEDEEDTKRNNLKHFKDCYLKDKARIWS